MKIRWKRMIWLALGTYVGFLLLLFFIQRSMIYLPAPGPVGIPEVWGKTGLTEVEFTTEDGLPLRALWWPGSRGTTCVVFHGNGGHRGGRIRWMVPIHALGYGVLILDYRGYGGNPGSPTEEGLYSDAEAALAWLRDNVPGDLVFIGESLGTGVAVEMATRHSARALVLHAPYPELSRMAARAVPFAPVRWILRDRFENLRKIPEIDCPKIFLHGSDDSIIPVEFGRELYEAAPEPREWHEFPGARHNDLFEADGYYEALLEFLVKNTD